VTDVVAPCSGRIVPIEKISDPVFSAQMLGPGVGIAPEASEMTVVAPIAGRVVKAMPHAFVVMAGSVGVLTHLGIDTVQLQGEGFTVLADEGKAVQAGDPMVRWRPGVVAARGIDSTVIVVAMDRPAGSVEVLAEGPVVEGDLLFRV